jgi:hypothetical protein
MHDCNDRSIDDKMSRTDIQTILIHRVYQQDCSGPLRRLGVKRVESARNRAQKILEAFSERGLRSLHLLSACARSPGWAWRPICETSGSLGRVMAVDAQLNGFSPGHRSMKDTVAQTLSSHPNHSPPHRALIRSDAVTTTTSHTSTSLFTFDDDLRKRVEQRWVKTGGISTKSSTEMLKAFER